MERPRQQHEECTVVLKQVRLYMCENSYQILINLACPRTQPRLCSSSLKRMAHFQWCLNQWWLQPNNQVKEANIYRRRYSDYIQMRYDASDKCQKGKIYKIRQDMYTLMVHCEPSVHKLINWCGASSAWWTWLARGRAHDTRDCVRVAIEEAKVPGPYKRRDMSQDALFVRWLRCKIKTYIFMLYIIYEQ